MLCGTEMTMNAADYKCLRPKAGNFPSILFGLTVRSIRIPQNERAIRHAVASSILANRYIAAGCCTAWLSGGGVCVCRLTTEAQTHGRFAHCFDNLPIGIRSVLWIEPTVGRRNKRRRVLGQDVGPIDTNQTNQVRSSSPHVAVPAQ
jgi:hypothetical protein